MLTASMFDDPVRERGRLGSSIIASMGDGSGKPTERVANPCLVTDAAEPNAIMGSMKRLHEGDNGRNPLDRDPERMRDDEMRALAGSTEMADLSRSDLILTIMANNKMCDCGRGTRIQFAKGRYLKWRRCHRCLTRTSPLWIPGEKALYAKWQEANRKDFSEHCLSNLRDPGYE